MIGSGNAKSIITTIMELIYCRFASSDRNQDVYIFVNASVQVSVEITHLC